MHGFYQNGAGTFWVDFTAQVEDMLLQRTTAGHKVADPANVVQLVLAD